MKRNIRSLKMFSSVQIRFLFIRCESFFSSGASLQQTGRTAFNQSTSGSAPPGESGPLVRRSEENSIHDSRRGMRHSTSLRLDGVRFGQLDACSLGCTGYAKQTHLDQHNKKPNINKIFRKRI